MTLIALELAVHHQRVLWSAPPQTFGAQVELRDRAVARLDLDAIDAFMAFVNGVAVMEERC